MIDKSVLRELVKSVIAEEVAAIRKPAHNASAPEARTAENVRIAGDADLVAFARKVLSLAGDPAKAKEIAAGRYPFRLEAAAQPTAVSTPPSAPKPASSQSLRIESGVVTETMLNKLPRGTARLVLAPGVTITPLAKGPRPRPWPHLRKDLTMIRGHVIGRYWATKKIDLIPSGAFLEVESAGGGRIIALDVLGCGEGRGHGGDRLHRLRLARRRQDSHRRTDHRLAGPAQQPGEEEVTEPDTQAGETPCPTQSA